MKTIIFDIDGTLTDMWPIEKSVLLDMTRGKFQAKIEKLRSSGISDTYKIFLQVSKQKLAKKKYTALYNVSFNRLLRSSALPKPDKYSIVTWVIRNRRKYNFVYATGGQKDETRYALRCLGLTGLFDLDNSIDKNNCRFSKRAGIPFRKMKAKFGDCVLITDSQSDCHGAITAGISFVLVKPRQKIRDPLSFV